MGLKEDEDALLRTVALQNAQTVVLARRRAEEELRRQSAWLRVTLASIGDAVISTDTRGNVTSLNAAAEDLTGWSSAEAMGRPLPEIFHIINETTREPVENPAHRALRNGTVVGLANHTILIGRDGTEHPIDDSAAPIRNDEGNIIGVVLVFRDITDRRQNEELHLQSEERLRFIMDSMPQKVFTAKPDGDVDYLNSQWSEYTALTFEELCGWEWMPVVHPDDLTETLSIWRGALASGEDVRIEHRLRRWDGDYRWHLIQATAMRDEEDRIVMWVGSATDIHEQREAATRLRRLAADLSEADRRKNEFLAMLAHELRNPLAPLTTALRIIQSSEGDAKAVKSASAMMKRQVDQLVRLVDDLLDVSRISRGKIELRLEDVDLATAIHHAVENCRPSLDDAGLELVLNLPGQPVELSADPARLTQVFANLLNNAIKYTDAGGRISIDAESRGGEAVVMVKDTGAGIPQEMLHSIFEMFAQVDRTVDRSQGGLGIGLTLVKNLVELHGGTVEVQSEGFDRGSEFIVRLPLGAESGVSTRIDPAATAAAPSSNRRILVVDDNQDAALSLALLLQIGGHETRTASDGLEAISSAEEFRPDVVLLDIGLPILNGYEAARKIREHPWSRDMLLVALTGWGQDEDRQRSTEAGFDRHLVKPVDHETLMKLVNESPRSAG